MSTYPAALYLEKGHLFEGVGFGAKLSKGGEAVFNTGLSGYQEIYTDPSYLHQIVVMGCVQIGNTGINAQDMESKGVHLSGIVVREYCSQPSSWRATSSLGDFLEAAKVPGIHEVDTREITQILRDEGAQSAILFPTSELPNTSSEFLKGHGRKLLEKVPPMEGLDLVSKASCATPYEYTEVGWKKDSGTVVVYDYGVKLNILRHFGMRDFKVQVVPYHMPAEEVLAPSLIV